MSGMREISDILYMYIYVTEYTIAYIILLLFRLIAQPSWPLSC